MTKPFRVLDQTTAIEGLLNDLNRDLSEYLSNLDNQEEELEEVTRRLDLINHLKSKYGNSLEQIMKYCSQCEEKLKIYRDYDEYIEKLEKKVKKPKKI